MLAVIVEERRDQRVRAAGALGVAVVAMEEERRYAHADGRSGAVAEVWTDEGERAVRCPRVRRGQEKRRVEVAAVFSRAGEEQRCDPVVVLARSFAVDDRTRDDDVIVSVAHAPERREDDVHVERESERRL